MDYTNGYVGLGNATVIPQVIVWAVGKRHPELIEEIQTSGDIDRFREVLGHYGALRVIAERLQRDACLSCCDAYGGSDDGSWHLTPEDHLHAVTHGDWRCTDPKAEKLLVQVLHALNTTFKFDTPDLDRHIETPWRPVVEANHAAFGLAGMQKSEHTKLPASALVHMNRQLLGCDDGDHSSFWATAYTSAIGKWLEQDLPDVADEIVKSGLTSGYFKCVSCYCSIMLSVEAVWQAMSYPIRMCLLKAETEGEALGVARTFVTACSKSQHEEEVLATLLWEMVKRRNHRKEPKNIFVSDASDPCIDAMRSRSEGKATGYLVDTESLPDDFRNLTDEKQALVVFVPDDLLENLEGLTRWDGLDCYFRKYGSDGRSVLSLAISRLFCCDHKALWPLMFEWRRRVPVVYIFDAKAAMALHKFNHFVDLLNVHKTSHRHRDTVVVTEVQCSTDAAAHVVLNGHEDSGRRLSVIPDISDLRSRMRTDTLSETFHRDHPQLEGRVSF
ncbi:hypothetical protein [Paraburkholderia caribensis]|nr:hypothetical protein [Paraburkholderia caribensis]